MDQKQWDKKQQDRQASFLQSFMWGEFQRQTGSKPHYLLNDDWSCLLLEKWTPLGRYLFAPYGPTLGSDAALKNALMVMKKYCKDNGFDWLRIEPMISGGPSAGLKSQLPAAGAKKSGHNREPDMTRIIDLTPPADEILSSVSQSTRSFIRKNQREKILNFKTSTEPKDINIFIQMLAQVTDRKNVYFFDEDYFIKQAQTLMPAGMMRLEIALDNKKPVASAVFHDYSRMSTYSFAASFPEARQTSASALLLWQAMLNAKQRGSSSIDLYGIAPDNAPDSHPWSGFSSFKKKFGGEIVEYAGTWDIPINQKYKVYRGADRIRRLKKKISPS